MTSSSDRIIHELSENLYFVEELPIVQQITTEAPEEASEESDHSLKSLSTRTDLIINILQKMQVDQDEHISTAARREDVSFEVEQVRLQLREAIKDLHKHLQLFSIRRILTAISGIVLLASMILLAITTILGPILLASPIPELSVIISMVFLLMARFAPHNQK